MAVGFYQGQAVVVLPNVRWFAAEATLESVGVPGNEAWRGTLTSGDPRALWDNDRRARSAAAVGWVGK